MFCKDYRFNSNRPLYQQTGQMVHIPLHSPKSDSCARREEVANLRNIVYVLVKTI